MNDGQNASPRWDLWGPLRYTTNEVEDILARSRLGPLLMMYEECPEAMRLTLAEILRNRIRMQCRQCRQVTGKESNDILRLSRQLRSAIEKLQRLDGPPPLLPLENGMIPSEAWARLGVGLAPKGRPPLSDPEAVGQLTAFYQLVLGQNTPKISAGPDAPLTRFIGACFASARARLERWQTEHNFEDRQHSLHAPSFAALRDQLRKLGSNEVKVEAVKTRLQHWRREVECVYAGKIDK